MSKVNDTRYTSVAPSKLLALLYGGRDIDLGNGKETVVFATSGYITAALRHYKRELTISRDRTNTVSFR